MKSESAKNLLRLLIGVGLVAFLLWQATRSEAFDRLYSEPKDPAWLLCALALLIVSVLLSFLRWRVVVEAAGLRMTLAEALRLGMIGFVSNFIALGNVGGDLVKAALLARRRPGSRALAVTTVLVDRLIGLYGLLICAGLSVLVTQSARASSGLPEAARLLAQSTLGAAAVATLGFLFVIAPGRPLMRIAVLLGKTPLIGDLVWRAALLANPYQRRRGRLVTALGIGLAADAMIILSFYAVATGLPMASPGVADHFLLVPLAMIAGALPISPSGLGTVEATAEMLYRALGAAEGVLPGDGTLVALTHRLVTLTLGALAVVFYFTSLGGERAATKPISDGEPGLSQEA